MSTPEQFHALMREVTEQIGNAALDQLLEDLLNRQIGSDSATYARIFQSCRQGIEDGWMCQYAGGGIRYGRVIKPDPVLNGYSVDVVDMNNLAGPHHRHPQGEIDLVMPLSEGARFDGRGAGWLVYGPDSAHSPTVSDGQALVLYLLPAGAIEFTRKSA